MRTSWLSFALSAILGVGAFLCTAPESYAQRFGRFQGGYGGYYGGWGGYGGGGYGGNYWPGYFAGRNWGYGYSYPYYYGAYYSYPSYAYAYSSPYAYSTPYYYDSYAYSQPMYGYMYQNPSYQSGYYSPGQGLQPSGAVKNVTINDGNFSPSKLEIDRGTTVHFTNKGEKMHNVAQPQHDWKSRDINPGESYTWTFTEPGTYSLECGFQPKMKMTVTVK
jgi:plastocyanin